MRGPGESWFPSVTSEGVPVYASFRRSPMTGWTVAIGLPMEFVDAPLRRAQLVAFGGGGVVLGLSLVLGWWMARAIRRPVQALTMATKALGKGEPIGELVGGVRELDVVGNELRRAADALARNREDLESTVAERTRELAAANERLRAEIDAREQAQSALLQAQKMEAMGQLTGGVAHDFNNLLTAVSGSLTLLEQRISDERSLRLLRTAQRGASQGAKLTDSLLAFARKQRLNPIPADLNSIIADMTEMLRPPWADPWKSGMLWLQRSVAGPGRYEPDRDRAPQRRSQRARRDAGRRHMLIETANIAADNEDLPKEVAACDCVLVSVRDTGSGMSPEVLDRVFEPFFTTKEVGKGTGLGLSMVFGVVRQSGGTVRILSRLREGTTVQIYLPRAIDNTGSAIGRATQARAPEGADILVVDDDPDVRWIIAQDLQEMGYAVSEADSGRAALTILESDAPCDLLVADLVMPGLSGLDTLRLARRSRPDLKVLFVSGLRICRASAPT